MKSVIYKGAHERLTLGQLLTALMSVYSGFTVKFSDGTIPKRLISWRGSYCEPSLTHEDEGETTVLDLVKLIDAALAGQMFEGYKGGKYRFDKDSPVNVDNPGNYTERGVVDVLCDGKVVMLVIADFSGDLYTDEEDSDA